MTSNEKAKRSARPKGEGRDKGLCVLASYFLKHEDAKKALWELQQKGYSRLSLLRRTADGAIRIKDPFVELRLIWTGLSALALAALAVLFWTLLIPFAAWPGYEHVLWIPILAGGLTGSGFGWLVYRRSRFGLAGRVRNEHVHWLLADESVLLLQAPLHELRIPQTIIRNSSESQPTIFLLYPQRKEGTAADLTTGTMLPRIQLEEHARRLAKDHRLKAKPAHTDELLRCINSEVRTINRICRDLSAADRLEQPATASAEWILDNEYIIESNARDIQTNLPRRYFQELPLLESEPHAGLPRIYSLADELALHIDLWLDRETLTAYLKAYQTVSPLTIGELWALPQILRIVLIENIRRLGEKTLVESRERAAAGFWANRLISANRRNPGQLFAILARLTDQMPSPSEHFATQLLGYLYDEANVLVLVQNWLTRTLSKGLGNLTVREQNRQAKDLVSIGNAFSSLRQLALTDWRRIFEATSRVERILATDPAGTYPQMDFETRNRYRRAVEETARESGILEHVVAERVVGRCAQALEHGEPEDDRLAHVGYYLIGEGRRILVEMLGCRRPLRCRFREWLYARHAPVFFLFLGLIFSALYAPALFTAMSARTAVLRILLAAGLVLPVSQLAVQVLNYLLTRILPPRTLPKMDFERQGVPDAFRTLVVVPTLLSDSAAIRGETERLEIRYLGNKDSNIFFSLFTDFKDSATPHRPEDASLLREAVALIDGLNRKYGEERFFLFHREREWSDSEQAFIGRDRKRGKLGELHHFLENTRPENAPPLLQAGNADRLHDIRFLITLDSDTQLPPGTARRMIETLAHPLNRPRPDGHGGIRPGTYTILQPRVSPSLPSALASPFSRLFADAAGVDPYTRAVSDVYQDLIGEASYNGKGIYDLRSFHRTLTGRFPREHLLSHDLIEGEHVRTALVSDIELFDEFPRTYYAECKRRHRWIRGDWQIIDWLLPTVPIAGGRRGPNQLSAISRWKIFDNLRRSLVPIANLGLLILSWTAFPAAGWLSLLIVVGSLFFDPISQLLTVATSRDGWTALANGKLGRNVLRCLVEAAMLPYHAYLSADAIVRVGYRRMVSHRFLLQWTPAQAVGRRIRREARSFILSLFVVAGLSAGTGAALLFLAPAHGGPAFTWLMLWCLSPAAGWVLSMPSRAKPQGPALSAADRTFLRLIARRTWRFFSECIGEFSAWLPPDNYQISHQNRIALRTSPTNIGFGMVSMLAARSFGYATTDQVVESLTRSMETIQKLDRYEGHLLNWYNLQTLEPLEPRYVSMVDSGNLLAALYSLETGLEELLGKPLLDGGIYAGLLDTARILSAAYERETRSGAHTARIRRLARILDQPPLRAVDALQFIRRLDKDVADLAVDVRRETSAESESAGWMRELENQTGAIRHLIDRYFPWLEILAEGTDSATPFPVEIRRLLDADLNALPSLTDLAEGTVDGIRAMPAFLEELGPADPPLRERADRALQAFSTAKWLAGEMLGMGHRLLDDIRDLYGSVNMAFLYDRERRLFSIGFNVAEGRLDNSYYDLLASEARLGSYVAIARGEVPIDHWFALGRLFRQVGKHQVLISWTGTMFEYLMPFLFQWSYENSLLDRMTKEAVAVQIAFGKRRHVPWGQSESAFGDLDINRTYQYKAFGVPALGLKRQTQEEIVVAPYASLLALPTAPRETVRNLRRLAGYDLLGDLGFYDAIDFSRRTGRKGRRGINIQTYMVHHQSMAFLSLANFLLGNPIRRYFHSTPLLRATELLLHERIPLSPPMHVASTRERAVPTPPAVESKTMESLFKTPHTLRPRTVLLGHARYGVMLTNGGGGYSRWGDFDITRWSPDGTRDSQGTFCYLREASSGNTWSTVYHPVGGKIPEDYSAHFSLERAVFWRKDHGIDCGTEIFVSAEEDVEVRRITLINRTVFTRRLDLTSYLELSLAPHKADAQHPAFQKLFVRTEALPTQRTLLAWRRKRSPDDPPVFVAHRFTGGKEFGPMRFETDRLRFIGRGRTPADPMGAAQLPGNSEGFVLDPILSIRETVVLEPGQRAQLSLVMAAGESREKVLALAQKFSDPHAIDRAADFTWTSAQIELRSLRIQMDDARRFQTLASHMIYPSRVMRPSAERLEENSKGQAGLWPYGISGDLPILTVSIGEPRDLGLIRQVLQAHSYWRKHGLWSDLLILNEEAGGYERPLKEQLERLIQAYAMHTGIDRPGGIFLRHADQIPDEDLNLMKAASSVVMVAARGALSQQLSGHMETPEAPEKLETKRPVRDPSPMLPFMELPYFNSLGGFTPDGREYAIYLGPHIHTPAPWVNVLSNPSFGTVVSETGSGFTWSQNSQRNRLTAWSNDPVLDSPSEAIYIRDEETGAFWTPTAAPVREGTAYRARHGAGYTVFEHNSNGIEQELTVLVPLDGAGGIPVKWQRLVLKNDTARRRRLSVTYFVEWTLGEHREGSQLHITTHWDDESRAILARNRYHPEYGGRVAFAAMNPLPDSYGGDRTAFLGRNRSMSDPSAMEMRGLSGRTGAGLDPCAALQAGVELDPGEEAQVFCLLGQTESVDAARDLIIDCREDLAFESAMDETRARWDELLGGVEIHTPELSVDFLVNRWLLYQSLSCRMWARSAFYQSGGAYGFRDQLQDCLAFLHTAPEIAREHILRAAGRQFVEGDVQHWWHVPGGDGVRTRISDDPLWLTFATAEYVRLTGDTAILKETVPFLNAPPLEDDQYDQYGRPEPSVQPGTLYEHCLRALEHVQPDGPHGLPHIGTGDWNDGLNSVGEKGAGESVWLAWFLCRALEDMAELATAAGQPELAANFRKRRTELAARVESAAWDGKWYLRAFFDDGIPLGSTASDEGRIFSMPQSWAALCGAGDPASVRLALDSAWRNLVKPEDGLALLFEPPLDSLIPIPGYLQGYPPGVRENGGQYTHAALWLAMAMARLHEADRAAAILRMANPVERARDPDSVWRYGLEPYAVAADIYNAEGYIGRGGWSWYTGSAGWLYRAWVEEILGLKVRGGRMRIDPVIPGWWDGFRINYRCGEAVYEIRVENPEHRENGVVSVEMDGRPLPDGWIPLERHLIKHRVAVRMGKPPDAE
ncbi:MAG: GH36-type glycosyl hydrolase domain-containing protein [Anaerolineales bacterium]